MHIFDEHFKTKTHLNSISAWTEKISLKSDQLELWASVFLLILPMLKQKKVDVFNQSLFKLELIVKCESEYI